MNKLLVIVFSLSLFTVPMLGQRGQVSLKVDPGNDKKVEVRQGGDSFRSWSPSIQLPIILETCESV